MIVVKTAEECGIPLVTPPIAALRPDAHTHRVREGKMDKEPTEWWGKEGYPYRCGPNSLLEQQVFCGLFQLAKPKRVFEIGTWWGITAQQMQMLAPAAQVKTLDHKDWLATRPKIFGEPDRRIEYVIANSITYRPGLKEYQSYDFCFVDGAHVDMFVASDVRLAECLIRIGGMIVCHDAFIPESEVLTWREGYPHSDITVSRWLLACPWMWTVVKGTSIAFLWHPHY